MMRTVTLGLLLSAVLLAATACGSTEQPSIMGLDDKAFAACIVNDVAAVRRYRTGLQASLLYAQSDHALFSAEKLSAPRMLSVEQKDRIRHTWRSILDYVLALDSIGKYHRHSAVEVRLERRQDSLAVFRGAYVASYAFALDFIELAENDPALDVILNEAVDELGLPKGSYSAFKTRFLNVLRATEFGALAAVTNTLGASDRIAPLQEGIDADTKRIWQAGAGQGAMMTFQNGISIIEQIGFAAYFPVQKGVAEWMGDTKVLRHGRSLITAKQIRQLAPRLMPGDILIERRSWYLSNIGLPGYWPHAALYVGTPDERTAYFNEARTRQWVRDNGSDDGQLETLLQMRYPAAYKACGKRGDDGHRPRVIEAVSEGVVFTTLEHSAACDTLVVFRPRMTRSQKALALTRAFAYHGRPYDFNFDFVTDQALVCTELIYKAYEPGDSYTGLNMPVRNLMGRRVTPANDIVRWFDETYGTDKQRMNFVLFIDSNELKGKAAESDLATLRASWRRPRWHMLTPSN